MSIPLQLSGKDFEEAFILACKRLPGVDCKRYGTKASVMKDEELSKIAKRPVTKTVAVASAPDFDIAIAPLGQQRIAELKVCGAVSFPMRKTEIKPVQVEWMLDRSVVGVPAWLIIHFTERKSATTGRSLSPAFTVALPVSDRHPRWRQFVNAHHFAKKTKTDPQTQPSITREEALREGRRIEWIVPPGCRNAVPDLAGLLGISTEPPAQGSLF